MPSMKRNTPAVCPPIRRLALAAIASKTGCTSDGELAITFRISAVAACCSRASVNSLLRLEAEERFDRTAVGAIRRLVLPDLRPFNEPALRVFAALVLSLVLDGRAISAPKGQEGYVIGPSLHSGRGRFSLNWLDLPENQRAEPA